MDQKRPGREVGGAKLNAKAAETCGRQGRARPRSPCHPLLFPRAPLPPPRFRSFVPQASLSRTHGAPPHNSQRVVCLSVHRLYFSEAWTHACLWPLATRSRVSSACGLWGQRARSRPASGRYSLWDLKHVTHLPRFNVRICKSEVVIIAPPS